MLVTLLAFVFVLGVLVFIHEFGHFILAKIVGIRVERFSLGFPPRMIGKQIGETDYCISWVPIGGYVKMSGMIDESMDQDSIKGEPWEFMSKPYYQRFLVIFAGPLMNILLAVFIFATMTFVTGVNEPVGPTVGDLPAESYLAKHGLIKGDLLVRINEQPVTSWQDVQSITGKGDGQVQLFWQRSDSVMSAEIVATFMDSIPVEARTLQPVVGSVIPGFPADSIDLKPGDRIVSINDTLIATWSDITTMIFKHPGQPVRLVWQRNHEQMQAMITPIKDPTDGYGKIGIAFQVKHEDVGLFASLGHGVSYSIAFVDLVYKSLKRVFTGHESFKSAIGGPIRIAQMAGDSARAGGGTLLYFMAVLSLNLGLLNLLPIPVLDGGHLLILGIEAVIRRPISTRAKLIIQQVGMALLLGLMVFVIINDIQQWGAGK